MFQPAALRLLFLAGLTLLGLAGYSFVNSRSGPAVSVEQDNVDAGVCPAGKEVEVIFRLRNLSGHPVRILDLTVC